MKIVVIIGLLLGTTFAFSQEVHKKKMAPLKLETKHSAFAMRVAPVAPQKLESRSIGVVRYDARSECASIEVMENGRMVVLHPVNMPEASRLNGKQIMFNSVQLKTVDSSACKRGKHVSVYHLTEVKRSE